MCTRWLYLSSEAVPFLFAAGLSPCQEPSSAAAVHYAARRYAAACTPALSSAQRQQRRKEIRRENKEREIIIFSMWSQQFLVCITFYKDPQIPSSSHVALI